MEKKIKIILAYKKNGMSFIIRDFAIKNKNGKKKIPKM